MNGFQAAFAEALFAPPMHRDDGTAGDAEHRAPALLHDVFAHPAFAVYRNTVMKGCIDALEANFPAVARVVGNDWFRSAAAEYVRARPPRDARLLAYGDQGFGAFLQALPSAAALPWLASVARLDTLWRAVHVAGDAPLLHAHALAGQAPDALAERVLAPHPAACWAWFDDAPIASLWSRNRASQPADAELVWQGEGLLLTRPAGAVQWQPLTRAGCALLDACADGLALGVAAEQALQAQPETDLALLLAHLLQAGAFTASHPGEPDAHRQ
jgi:hypothetical protein